MNFNKFDGRKLKHNILEHYRYRCIKLYKSGERVIDIARRFGFRRESVSRWINRYKKNGKKSLRSRKAPGPRPKLSKEDAKNIIKLIKKPATEYGYETPLWTCKRIQQLVKKVFGKDLHLSNIWRWLVSWDLSPQKPERYAIECNEKEMKRWLKEEWPKIKAHAQRWHAMLYFQDEAGVSLTAVLGRTWAPKGKTPIVKVTGKRGGFCVSSAISPAGRLVFRLEDKKVNSQLHIEFLKQIMKHHPSRKIIVVEDRAPPHIAKKVENFVNENKKKFALYYLPSYSPKLNPDEKTWAYLKTHKLKTHQAKSTIELRKIVLSTMRSIQRNTALIQTFFYELDVT
jgi:transposase